MRHMVLKRKYYPRLGTIEFSKSSCKEIKKTKQLEIRQINL
jgi:hypothetical protein